MSIPAFLSSFVSRANKSFLSEWFWTVDRVLFSMLLLPAVIGIGLVATASPPVAERIGLEQFYFLKKHIFFLTVSLGLMTVTSFLKPKLIWRLATFGLLGTLVCMVLALVVGMEAKGARRWIYLFGFSLQPSEFLKVFFTVMGAWFLYKQKLIEGFPGLWLATGLYVLCVLLLMLQPDFGMTVVTTAIFGVQLLLFGIPLWILFGLAAVGVAGLIFVYFVFDHVRSRIDRFFDPESGDTFQIDRSLESFRGGGLFGAGPGQGEIKLSLPDAHADFVFSVAAEEFGMVFILFLVLLFSLIVHRGFRHVVRQDDLFVLYAGAGLLTMFGFQAFIHMGSSLQLLPAKGMTLPFVSYGGSSMLAIALAMGIVLSLTRGSSKRGIAKSGLPFDRYKE